MTDLAPCPFCGNAAELEDHRLCWLVKCSSCGAGVMGDQAPEPAGEVEVREMVTFLKNEADLQIGFERQHASIKLTRAADLLEMCAFHAVAINRENCNE